jgi:hypothetical protein
VDPVRAQRPAHAEVAAVELGDIGDRELGQQALEQVAPVAVSRAKPANSTS